MTGLATRNDSTQWMKGQRIAHEASERNENPIQVGTDDKHREVVKEVESRRDRAATLGDSLRNSPRCAAKDTMRFRHAVRTSERR